MQPFIHVNSDKPFYFNDPDNYFNVWNAESDFINDFVIPLSYIPRFLAQGHENSFSVLKHVVVGYEIAQRIFGQEVADIWLYHDCHESFTADLPRPLQNFFTEHLPGFKPLLNKLQSHIDNRVYESFGVDHLLTPSNVAKFKALDTFMSQEYEMLYTFKNKPSKWSEFNPNSVPYYIDITNIMSMDVMREYTSWMFDLSPERIVQIFMDKHEGVLNRYSSVKEKLRDVA
jgi:hypothetical protein